jgi:hypothetical protein
MVTVMVVVMVIVMVVVMMMVMSMCSISALEHALSVDKHPNSVRVVFAWCQ